MRFASLRYFHHFSLCSFPLILHIFLIFVGSFFVRQKLSFNTVQHSSTTAVIFSITITFVFAEKKHKIFIHIAVWESVYAYYHIHACVCVHIYVEFDAQNMKLKLSKIDDADNNNANNNNEWKSVWATKCTKGRHFVRAEVKRKKTASRVIV